MRWIDEKNLLEVGQVTKVSNFKREIYIFTFEKYIFSSIKFLFVEINKKPVPFFIEELSVLKEDLFKVKLFNNKAFKDLTELLGCFVMLRKDNVKIKNKIVDKLIKLKGFTLKDKNSGFSGIVSDYIDRAHQPLLVVDGNKNIIYVPFVKPLVTRISYKEKCIYCNLPDGLV